ncbi:hypothetical protein CLV59_107106 [Chitinophaga dinghuensis]|uniref:Uncharacterized protein n=1 Tax=Chitinophaga dinghuensis TaxID=1539050 RepID=A0A327VTH6_9BACT|nr:hypothetical protein CLV59_107106 [Chitinophaga dinghuensis]
MDDRNLSYTSRCGRIATDNVENVAVNQPVNGYFILPEVQ